MNYEELQKKVDETNKNLPDKVIVYAISLRKKIQNILKNGIGI